MGDTTNGSFTLYACPVKSELIALGEIVEQYFGQMGAWSFPGWLDVRDPDACPRCGSHELTFEGAAASCSVCRWDGPKVETEGELHNAPLLGEEYGDDVGVGLVGDIAGALAEAAPRATWELHTDPAYEFLGEVAMHVPGLGLFVQECDADGTSQLSLDAIEKIYEQEMPRGAKQLMTLLRHATGKPWTDAIARERRRLDRELKKRAA